MPARSSRRSSRGSSPGRSTPHIGAEGRMGQVKDAAHDDTIDMGASGTDATLASGADATLAVGSHATLASGAGANGSGIRAGRPADYVDLAPVDPKHFVLGKELARGGMGRIIAARDR